MGSLYSEVIKKPSNISQNELIQIVNDLNNNDKIHGILVQSPLPAELDELTVTLNIKPEKEDDEILPTGDIGNGESVSDFGAQIGIEKESYNLYSKTKQLQF